MPVSMSASRRVLLLLAFAITPWAQAQSAPSRIAQVKVYPGSATVDRVARLAPGSRSFSFDCLPAGLDVQSLQVSADASVQLGETSVQTRPRAQVAACQTSALDGRIRELEDRQAAIAAERDALGYVTDYLRGLGSTSDGKRSAPDAKGLATLAEALRRNGQDALLRQHQLTRQHSDIARQLQPLLSERERTQGTQGAQVTAVTVTLDAPREAELRLSYQIRGPGWTPAYRALLDTSTRKLRIERQALVAQASGEDWQGVKLVLSTGQPQRNTSGRTPPPWRIGVAAPPPVLAKNDAPAHRAMMAPAPAPVAMALREHNTPPSAPLFDVSVFQGSFATEFSVAQPITVPSNGQRVAMALGQHEDTAQLAARISPRVESAAYLIAELAQPAGVWPAGALQLYRDGAFVGTGQWSAPANVKGAAKLSLSFGRDELLHVQVEPEQDHLGSTGFAGGRAERRVQRAYLVENRHRSPIAVQVLEAAPVSVDEQVRVDTQFSPQVADTSWNQQPGVAMWRTELAAGQSARFAAEHTISYPKDVRLQER